MDSQAPLQRKTTVQTVPQAWPEPADVVQDGQSDDANYVGSTHWTAILDDLHDLKALLRAPSETQDVEAETHPRTPQVGSDPIFGTLNVLSQDEIIAEYLPAKVEVDRLLSTFFQGPSFITPFLHAYQFQRQYREFWSNTAVNPLWLSILFSICFLSSRIRNLVGPTGPPLKEPFVGNSFLHTAAGQCLVLGEYHRPQEFAVEALLMYAQSKHVQTLDPNREAGVVLSMAVRTAYHLGYHRDPDLSGSFTAFECEMRRRRWAVCKQMDLMTSFELGLPSNIMLENSDTKSPRNLSDSDFGEDTTHQQLPPSRPETEATPLLWFIVKDRMIQCFSKVCRDALSFHVKSESDIFHLDQEIRQMYETIPVSLRVRPMSESITESPFIIMTRLYVEFIHWKCLCVLHRRYMARGNAFSTASCIEAGKTLVSQFVDVCKEFNVGGQLYMQRWMLTNYTMNDFLLGVMVLCLALHTRRNNDAQDGYIDGKTEHEILALLESAHTVLVQKSEASRDARRASSIVRLTLDSVSPKGSTSMQSSSFTTQNLELSQSQVPGYHGNQIVLGPNEPFQFMNDPIGDLDWTLFDPELLNQDTF